MFMIKNKEAEVNEEEKKMAQELNEAIERDEKKGAAAAATDEYPDCEDITPEDELSSGIAVHLAALTAERIDDMMDGMDLSVAKQIIIRLEKSEPETMVSMIQAMFLAKGMEHAAEDLDILADCGIYDETVYDIFQDELSDTELFDWFRIEYLLDGCRKKEECSNMLKFPLEVVV